MNGVHLMPKAEYYVAVDNVCAWPNLTLLPSGEIAAAVYNRPAHGFGCGEVDLWVSDDGGRMWGRRSAVSDHSDAPDHVRMNHAVGLNREGHLVALVSGWSENRAAPVLPVQICVSADGGHTWQRTIWELPEAQRSVPFGDLVVVPNGALACCLYRGRKTEGGATHDSFVCRSTDGGRTWGDERLVAADVDETAPARLSSGEWLAACRGSICRNDFALTGTAADLALYRSQDEGRSWEIGIPHLTIEGQHPGHLLPLRDGRVLLSYGSRITGLYGACVRISEDEGMSWSRPRMLVGAPGPMDCGYPSSVELPDGTIVTAYYAGPRTIEWARKLCPYSLPWHQRYHMGVCRWRAEGFEFVDS